MLGISKKRLAGELVWIPQGEDSMFDAIDPEESRRDKIKTQVPFGKEVSPVKEVVKKE